jgi:alkylation response protein AidB-like acyl-CoA dehydrogenase
VAGNFYRDNPDLRFHMARVDWGAFVPGIEDEFREAALGGPSSLEESVETGEQVLDLVGELVAEKVAPTAASVDVEGCRLEDGVISYAKATVDHLAALRDTGLFGFCLDRRYGGQNLPLTLYTASVELVSRGCASLMTLYALQGCGDTIQSFASEELRREFLPGIASGALSCCMSLTEADAGSALGQVACRATPVDEARGRFRLDGSKTFSTNGGADVLLVLARSEPGTTDARGLSLFLVPRSDRVVVAKLEEKLGLHGSPTALLHLEGAEGRLVGERRRGLTTYVLSLIHASRLEIAAQAIGISQAALTATARYVRERRQFGRAIEEFSPVRQQLLEMELLVQASRNLTYRTAEVMDGLRAVSRLLERHPADPRAAAWAEDRRRLERLEAVLTPLAKYYAAEAGNAVCYRALQLHGGYGYVRDYAVERHYRDVRITNIYEGTTEIQVGGIVALIAAGGADEVVAEISRGLVPDPADAAARARWDAGVAATKRAAAWLNAAKADKALVQLRARALSEMLADLVAGAQFLRHAPVDARKRVLAHAFLAEAEHRWEHNERTVVSGDKTALDHYAAVVAPYRV